MRHAATRFGELHPTVTIDVMAGGSLQGLWQVQQGVIDLGSLDLEPPEDSPSLERHAVATTAFAITAAEGPHLPASLSLRLAQVTAIFSGQLRDWQELGGQPGAIFVVNRPHASGSRRLFERLFFAGADRFEPHAPVGDNAGSVARTLAVLPGAISYLPLPYVRPPLRALAIDGVLPSPESLEAHTYPFAARGYLVTARAPRPVVAAFVELVTSTEFQRDELPRLGYLPVGATP